MLYSWEEDELFDIERLATITKATSHATQRNLDFIENLGMIAIENGKITFDPTVYELVKNWVSPELQSQIVKQVEVFVSNQYSSMNQKKIISYANRAFSTTSSISEYELTNDFFI